MVKTIAGISGIGLVLTFLSELGVTFLVGAGVETDRLFFYISILLAVDTVLKEGSKHILLSYFYKKPNAFFDLIKKILPYAVLLAVLSVFSLFFFKKTDTISRNYLIVISGLAPLLVFQYVMTAWLDSQGSHVVASLRSLLPAVCTFFIGLPLCQITGSTHYYFSVYVLGFILLVGFTYWRGRKVFKLANLGGNYQSDDYGELAAVSLPTITIILMQFQMLFERYLILGLGGGTLTGFLIAFKMFSSIQTVFGASFSSVIIRKALVEGRLTTAALTPIFFVGGMVGLLLSTVALIIPEQFLHVLGFSAISETLVNMLLIFCIFIPINNVLPLLSGGVLAFGQHKKYFYVHLGIVLIRLAGILLFFPEFGLWAIVVGICIGVLVASSVFVMSLRGGGGRISS